MYIPSRLVYEKSIWKEKGQVLQMSIEKERSSWIARAVFNLACLVALDPYHCRSELSPKVKAPV